MKKLIIGKIMISILLFTASVYGSSPMELGFTNVMESSYIEESFELDQKTVDKYQAVVKQFSKKLVKKAVNETSVVTYETTSYGVHVHCAWYPEWVIVSSLDGTCCGRQMIVALPQQILMAQSDIVKNYDGYFINIYPGGKITSYPNKQIIKFK